MLGLIIFPPKYKNRGVKLFYSYLRGWAGVAVGELRVRVIRVLVAVTCTRNASTSSEQKLTVKTQINVISTKLFRKIHLIKSDFSHLGIEERAVEGACLPSSACSTASCACRVCRASSWLCHESLPPPLANWRSSSCLSAIARSSSDICSSRSCSKYQHISYFLQN